MLSSLGIQDGNRFSVQDSALETPNMAETLDAAMRPITFVRIAAAIVNFQSKQVEYPLTTHGVVQPLSLRELAIKPEGQRAWSWIVVFARNELALKLGEIAVHKGKRYRLMGQWDWSESGYFRYEFAQIFDNATSPKQ